MSFILNLRTRWIKLQSHALALFPPEKYLQILSEHEVGWTTGQNHEGFRKGINRKRATPSLPNVPTALSGLHRPTILSYLQ